MRLVLASNNPGKLAELAELFAPLGVELVAQGALAIDEAEEPHVTFIENALAKARHAARASGGAAIADDSGLCVDVLGGAPGVASAHFAPIERDAGEDRESFRRRQDLANNRRLLELLRGERRRSAHFVATLVALRRADDPEPVVAIGRWGGELLESPRGSGGFGYDPLLFLPSFDRTVAELDPASKNRLSHRAQAADRMLAHLRHAWGLRALDEASASGR
ncbi:MAG TPA: RdgB/HAM1 family non-canonical purine NTP pyrophosphatase [Caldimonas sp.]|nr:RdgB/HAM1 family non-canonical purine NTP pyrophosphatase [Caldimonas sp.]